MVEYPNLLVILLLIYWQIIQCKMMSSEEEENYDFPKTLKEFGYEFNEEGRLRNIETGNGFNFVEIEDDHRFNQKRYEAIGDIITDYVYQLMEDEGLERVKIPIDAEESEPTSFFFQTKDAQSNADKLLILIHGSGPVKAGQWARRLIMNDCLDSGTQLPYIKWAMQNGYGVIVANTNINTDIVNNKKVRIRGSGNPEKHTVYLWENFVKPAKAKNIAIVAHSYGGVCTLNLVNSFFGEFEDRVFAMAFTDSVHSFAHQESPDDVIQFYKERAINWASAYDKLDTKLTVHMDQTPTVSAGTDKHELTSYTSMDSIFKYLTKSYSKHTGAPLPDWVDLEEAVEATEGDIINEDPEKQDVKASNEMSEDLKTSQDDAKDQLMSQDATDSKSMSDDNKNKDTDKSDDTKEDAPMSKDVDSQGINESEDTKKQDKPDKTVKSEL